MAALPSAPGLTWRPITADDVPAWHALVAAVEEADAPAERHAAEDLRELLLDGPGKDPAAQSLLGVDDTGTARAFGHVDPDHEPVGQVRVRLFGAVHPAWRRRGLGTAVLAWQRATAAELVTAAGHGHLSARLLLEAEERHADRAALAAGAGFAPVRRFHTMARSLTGEDGPLPEVGGPGAGLRLEPWSTDVDEAVRLAHAEAFADHWGSRPRTAEDWARTVTGHRDFRGAWSFVVLDGDEVAAYTLSADYPQDWAVRGVPEGYTTHVGVRPSHRRRGLARLLLARAMAAFAQDGLASAALDVDAGNATGALELYRGLGYRVRSTGVVHARDLPPSA